MNVLPSRRALLLGAASLAVTRADAAADASAQIARQLREAARTGAAVRLPPGVTALRGLDLPPRATLIGAPGRSVLRLIGPGPLLSASFAQNIRLESLALDGAGAYLAHDKGLIDFTDCLDFSIHDCVIRNSMGRGFNLSRSGGRFAQNTIEKVKDAGFFSLDGFSVDFDGCHVRDCGDNGVQFYASSAGRYDGSRVRNSLIEDIHNLSGGDGPYGNGVFIWASGGVAVADNRIYRCAYSAVRNNSGVDMRVERNDCRVCGEKAMYAEYGAKRSIFRDNRMHDVGAGIAVANAEAGTDGALVAGNLITGMGERHPDPVFGPEMIWLTGVLGEKNCEIVGNTVVGPGWIGVALGGWRETLRVEGNRLENLDYGVVFAVGEGAGDALIARNKIIGARKAAVAAREGTLILPGDALAGGRRFPRVTLRGNETL